MPGISRILRTGQVPPAIVPSAAIIFWRRTMRSIFASRPMCAAILGACVFAFAGQVSAHTFCAANSAQLRAALSAVSDGGAYANEEDTINIAGGTHHTDGQEFFYSSTSAHVLNIIGTGTQNCGLISQKASLTI